MAATPGSKAFAILFDEAEGRNSSFFLVCSGKCLRTAVSSSRCSSGLTPVHRQRNTAVLSLDHLKE